MPENQEGISEQNIISEKSPTEVKTTNGDKIPSREQKSNPEKSRVLQTLAKAKGILPALAVVKMLGGEMSPAHASPNEVSQTPITEVAQLHDNTSDKWATAKLAELRTSAPSS